MPKLSLVLYWVEAIKPVNGATAMTSSFTTVSYSHGHVLNNSNLSLLLNKHLPKEEHGGRRKREKVLKFESREKCVGVG